MNNQFEENLGTTQNDQFLPYQWDGECHLVMNDNFYSYIPHSPIDNISDLSKDIDFDIDFDQPYEKMEDYNKCEVKSATSTELSTGTTGTMASMMSTKSAPTSKPSQSLDAQLDFIMESTKKLPKPLPHEKKCTRSRKTPEQLQVLAEALRNLQIGQNIDKRQVSEISKKTKLSEMKVYKWFWDRGYKLQ